MDVGVQMIFSSQGWEGVSDSEVYDQEITLALKAEEAGFDALWPVEHHFFDYSFCPDNTEFLAYMAGRTERIGLGTAAVIMPWNDPIRVAERISLLDELSGGRVRFGMGRGLSRREYAPWVGIEMDEARGRFDESAAMVVNALKTGFIEGDGPYYPVPRTEIRPRPSRDFTDRIYAVAGSSDSVEAAADVGARMVLFAEAKWENRLPGIEKYRSKFKEVNGFEAPPMMTADFVYVSHDGDEARETAREHLANYLSSILEHYELFGDHFSDIKGYRGYGKQAEILQKIGFDGYLKGFFGANAFGTPDEVLEHFRERRDILGPLRAGHLLPLRWHRARQVSSKLRSVHHRGPARAAELDLTHRTLADDTRRDGRRAGPDGRNHP